MGKEFDIEKLKGSENFHNWCFAIKNVLQYKQLEKCIIEPVIETDTQKLGNCKAVLALSVDSSLYNHISSCETALEIWNTLKNLFEEKGITRRSGLLRSLMKTDLEDFDGMQHYIDRILELTNKLKAIGFEINDVWMTSILLAGLTEAYKPFVMGIEASDSNITADKLIAKLLDSQANTTKGDAFFSNKKKFEKNKKFEKKKCTTCKKRHNGTCNMLKNDPNGIGTAKNAFCAFVSKSENDWYIDSGASNHMTPHANILANKQNCEVTEIKAANGESMKVNGTGTTTLMINNNKIDVKNVLHVPGLSVNLLSVSKIVEHGNTVTFDRNKGCTISNSNNEIIANCKPNNGIYKFNEGNMTCLIAKNDDNALLWHRRLGHVNLQCLKKMREEAIGVKFNDDGSDIKNCETCAQAKQFVKPFHASETKSKNILELIHSDLCGPMETQSIGHAKYILTFIDDLSKKVFVYFLKSKSDVLHAFIEFRKYIELQMELKIKMIRTDNGGEYCSVEFEKYCKGNGIQHQLTTAYTPQQNGVAERMNRTLIEKAKCLLFDADLPKTYWAEATSMAAYLINRTISSSHGKVPNELFYNQKVDISNLKIFGSPVMVHITKQKRKKWDKKSVKMIFVGYDRDIKGFRCIDRNTRKIIVSRDVIFHETTKKSIINMDVDGIIVKNTTPHESTINSRDSINDDLSMNEDTIIPTLNDSEQFETPNTSKSSDSLDDSEYVPEENVENVESSDRTLRPKRSPIPPFQLNNLALFIEPASVSEAIKSEEADDWREAMEEEWKSHQSNRTWSLVPLPPGRKSIKAKWVFKAKRNDAGEVIRYKARLVAKGCAQKHGIDYNETFSPVVRYASIRFLIALAVKNGYKIHQMDAITAFLQGDLDEEIFMEQPECYEDGTKRVCQLNKAVYGLKQAGRQWNQKLDGALKRFGLKKCKTDPCIYYDDKLKIIIAIYVDDFLIFYRGNEELETLKAFLNSNFKMKDLGPAQSCLGIRIHQKKDSIEMDQSAYIKEILARFGMSECKPVGTPSDTSIKLSTNMTNENNGLVGKVPYQEAVGSLLHLTQGTRPDLAYAVNDVSRFNANHSDEHWRAVKRIFRYLKGTMDNKLIFHSKNDTEMHAYSDADWGSQIDDRRSCSGYTVIMSNAAISWCSKRQPIVALSSTEAEYIALSSSVREVIWIRQLAKEVDDKFDGPTLIWCDNQSTIKLAESEAYRPRTKHIDIRFHHTREKIDNKTITIEFCPTGEMTADSLTKSVTREKTQLCNYKMGLKSK